MEFFHAAGGACSIIPPLGGSISAVAKLGGPRCQVSGRARIILFAATLLSQNRKGSSVLVLLCAGKPEKDPAATNQICLHRDGVKKSAPSGSGRGAGLDFVCTNGVLLTKLYFHVKCQASYTDRFSMRYKGKHFFPESATKISFFFPFVAVYRKNGLFFREFAFSSFVMRR